MELTGVYAGYGARRPAALGRRARVTVHRALPAAVLAEAFALEAAAELARARPDVPRARRLERAAREWSARYPLSLARHTHREENHA